MFQLRNDELGHPLKKMALLHRCLKMIPFSRASGRRWREAPDEGGKSLFFPHPPFGHPLPLARERGNKRKHLGVLAFLIILPFTASYALPSDKDQPIHITSDTAHLDKSAGIGIFQGHVVLTQGTSIVKTNKLTLYSDKNNQLLKAVATGGNPSYYTITDPKKPPFTATGDMIQYIPPENKIVLTGNAKAVQGSDTYAAPEIEYHIDKEMVISAPSKTGRTTIVINPQSFQHPKE